MIGLIDDVLFEFKGQISVTELWLMTYLEIEMFRKHRQGILSRLSDAQKADMALRGELPGM